MIPQRRNGQHQIQDKTTNNQRHPKSRFSDQSFHDSIITPQHGPKVPYVYGYRVQSLTASNDEMPVVTNKFQVPRVCLDSGYEKYGARHRSVLRSIGSNVGGARSRLFLAKKSEGLVMKMDDCHGSNNNNDKDDKSVVAKYKGVWVV